MNIRGVGRLRNFGLGESERCHPVLPLVSTLGCLWTETRSECAGAAQHVRVRQERQFGVELQG